MRRRGGFSFSDCKVRVVVLFVGRSGVVDIQSLCVLHLRASVALFVYNSAICYIDVARNRN
jgi:hypothetical protein